MLRLGLLALPIFLWGCGQASKDFADARPSRKLDRSWRQSTGEPDVSDAGEGRARMSHSHVFEDELKHQPDYR